MTLQQGALSMIERLATTTKKEKKKKKKKRERKEYAFWRQFNEKPSIIPGCPESNKKHLRLTLQVLLNEPPQGHNSHTSIPR